MKCAGCGATITGYPCIICGYSNGPKAEIPCPITPPESPSFPPNYPDEREPLQSPDEEEWEDEPVPEEEEIYNWEVWCV